MGLRRLRAADRGLSDVEFGVVGVGFRSPFDDRSLRHGFEPCREEVRGVEVYILQSLVERRRVFVHLHNIGFGAVEQRSSEVKRTEIALLNPVPATGSVYWNTRHVRGRTYLPDEASTACGALKVTLLPHGPPFFG